MRSSFFSSCFLSLCALSILPLAGCAGLRPAPPPTQTFQLTVTAPPAGQGTITSTPAGINCPSTCTASFAQGTKVTLTAKPGTNYLFSGWSGACTGTSCTVMINAAKTVAASFIAAEGLNVALAGTGSGTVTSSPTGIDCPTTCSATFPDKTQVTLTEKPGTNFYFSGWGGACSGTTGCSLTVTAAENVTATFIAGDSLSVAISGTGKGTVTSSPAAINCTSGATTGCSATFAPGTSVSLSETTNAPNQFSGWTGACTGMGACSLTLSAATNSVTAAFAPGGTLQSLNHIILFAQENRSLDHYFGYMEQYWANNGYPQITAGTTFDGLPQFNPTPGPIPALTGCNPADTGDQCVPDPSVTVPSFHMQSVCTEELSPFWNEAHVDWDYSDPESATAQLNGFVIAGANDARQYPDQNPPINDVNGYRTMGYFTDADLNYYYYMASNFATSDRWFSPVMSRTQLNRAYILAATSQGYAYPPGSNSNDSAAFSSTPIFEALQNAGITWKIYVNSEGTGCANTDSACLAGFSYINMFTYYSKILADPTLLQNIVPVTQFTTDAQNGTLPQVALIEPASAASLDEHPSDNDNYPEDIQAGANYAAGLINTLMTSPSWKDSALVFTYDEGGGFYDHVSPQPAAVPDKYAYPIDLQSGDACDGVDATSGVCSFGMTGYRVPLIVISPFSKKNYVSHTVYDTTAVLALIEKRFGVAPLTARDAAQADMSTDFFDFVNVPWGTPPTPPTQTQSGNCSVAAPNP
jgi:phospholipase C